MMVDVLPVPAMTGAVTDQENAGQRSAGKRAREMDTHPSNKRQALASVLNQPPPVLQERRRKISRPFAALQPQPRLAPSSSSAAPPHNPVSFYSYCPLDTPSSVASPMVLSSPSGLSALTCTEQFDVDQVEDDDYAPCRDYTRDIFAYLMEAEVRFQPKVCYMSKQPDITVSMRCVLVDWLVEVTEEFSLHLETLHMAVSIIDRFLSCMSVLRGKLQLVGTAAIYIAAKVEEIYPPELPEFAYITDDTYTKQQIVRMEKLILQTLDYSLMAPSSLTFLNRLLMSGRGERQQQDVATSVAHLSTYFCELALVHSDPFLKYLPSVVAASALCLARHTLGYDAWPPILHHLSGYSVQDIGHCLQDLHRTFAMAPMHPQQAVHLKYCSDKFAKVATLIVPETLPM